MTDIRGMLLAILIELFAIAMSLNSTGMQIIWAAVAVAGLMVGWRAYWRGGPGGSA